MKEWREHVAESLLRTRGGDPFPSITPIEVKQSAPHTRR